MADTPQKSQKILIYGIAGILVLVIIAVIFNYVSLGAGYFTAQKSSGTGTVPSGTTVVTRGQETVYKNVEQAASNIQMVGQVYGLASDPADGIDELRFSIGLAPGAAPIDLRTMTITFSTPTTGPVILTRGQTASTTTFTTKVNGATDTSTLKTNEQVVIDFKFNAVAPNSKMTVELQPSVGAGLPFTRTAPARITNSNILY